MKFKNILCPTDFSAASNVALQQATRLAAQHGAQLHLLHVYELVFTDGYIEGMIPVPAGPDNDVLNRQLEKLKPSDVDTTCELVQGLPAGSIVAYAHEHDVDLIVLGTHARTGWSRLVMGSVTESVMRAAPCPVLVVHEPAHPTEEAPPSDVTIAV